MCDVTNVSFQMACNVIKKEKRQPLKGYKGWYIYAYKAPFIQWDS